MTQVTEDELRLPEFRGVDVDDLERRPDGKIVRKDRWMTGMFEVAEALDLSTREFEIQEVIDAAHNADTARDVLKEVHRLLSSLAPCAFYPPFAPGDTVSAKAAGKQEGRDEGKRLALDALLRCASERGYSFK